MVSTPKIRPNVKTGNGNSSIHVAGLDFSDPVALEIAFNQFGAWCATACLPSVGPMSTLRLEDLGIVVQSA